MRAVLRSCTRRSTWFTRLDSCDSLHQSRCNEFAACPLSIRALGSKKFSTSKLAQSSVASAAEQTPDTSADHVKAQIERTKRLPPYCSGCGAPSQTVATNEAGYYSLTRSGVRRYLKEDTQSSSARDEEETLRRVTASVDSDILSQLGLDDDASDQSPLEEAISPICDRCHNLLHHHTGVPIAHPSIQSIEAIIAESPYRANHIYHVIDAADFPMSLIPSLQSDLRLPRLRTQNRRSKSRQFVRDRVADVSFIITRSDLLAPKKEQVDGLMPYLREVLRGALGTTGKGLRLGNVRCVSARRGWWTKDVKEDIWKRGGAGWMVGKVNVGKSNLFEAVFPKGRGQDVNMDKLKRAANRHATSASTPTAGETPAQTASDEAELAPSSETDVLGGNAAISADEDIRPDPEDPLPDEADEDEPVLLSEDEFGPLLPPAQKETAYPLMPLISFLPGTTASPIRIPFGNGKGELIDLPGVNRSSLDEYVQEDHKHDLVMRARVTPEQHIIKPGQSLLLGGGLIRITPTTPDLIFLAYPFVPLHAHITSTDKAMAMQTGERQTNIDTVVNEGARSKIAIAGNFPLRWDVTRKRAGPLTDKSAAKLKPERLPFIVWSADILIEGVGWVEVVAQVRRKAHSAIPDDRHSEPKDSFATETETEADEAETEKETIRRVQNQQFPSVQVFSPEGKFVAVRPPMNAWLLGGKQGVPKHKQKARPRKSMRSLKMSNKGRERMGTGDGPGPD